MFLQPYDNYALKQNIDGYVFCLIVSNGIKTCFS